MYPNQILWWRGQDWVLAAKWQPAGPVVGTWTAVGKEKKRRRATGPQWRNGGHLQIFQSTEKPWTESQVKAGSQPKAFQRKTFPFRL